MPRAHSHYDNLKVARNAPTEVIRAAYRALAQRHHPDVNKSPDSARVMKILNEAWDVLGDPKKRAQHDTWISEQEHLEVGSGNASPNPPQSASGKAYTYTYTYTSSAKPKPTVAKTSTNASSEPATSRESAAFRELADWAKNRDAASSPEQERPTTSWFSNPDVKRGALGVALLAVLFSFSLFSKPDRGGYRYEPPAGSQPQPPPALTQPEPLAQAAQPQTKGFTPFSGELDKPASRPRPKVTQPTPGPFDDRQAGAPPSGTGYLTEEEVNGTGPVARSAQKSSRSPAVDQDQQANTGYVSDAPRLAEGGLSEFTVDNTSGSGDAIARLYLNGSKPAVRTFFVRHGERFTATSLSPAAYVLRYRYMGSETIYEADRPFQLRQEETESGTRYSQVRVTLYTVAHGNLRTKVVPKESF